MRRHAMQPYHFDGRARGLTSIAGRAEAMPLRKPWTIASTCNEFERLRRHYKCEHKLGDHAPVAGSDTKRTEAYTEELAREVRFCWSEACTPRE